MTSFARLLLAIMLMSCQHVFADGAAQPEVRLAAYRVVATPGADGTREHLEPLNELRPGDTIEYEATYINHGSQVAHNVQLTVPVPTGGVEYIAAQKAPLADAASTDGKRFAPLPLTRVETGANGKPAVRPVPLAEYRQLRWSLGDLPAGASRSVRARMHLPATPVATIDAPARVN